MSTDEGAADQAASSPRPHGEDGDELERQMAVARQLRATLETAARLGATTAADEVAQVAVHSMVDDLGAELGQVWLRHDPGRLRLVATAGAAVAEGAQPPVVELADDASLVGEVARTRLPVVISHEVGPLAPVLEDGRPLVGAAVLPAVVDDPSQPEGTDLLGVLATWFSGPVPLEVADVLSAFGSVVSAALHHASSRPQRVRDEAEQRFRSLVDGVGAVIWEADPYTFQASFVSRRAEELLGYPLQRWLEPGFWESTIHPTDRVYAVRYRQVATAEGGDHEVEYRMVAADGREVWIGDMFHVDLDEHARARRLTGVMLDITRRKRVEQALLESRERFASLARTLQASLLPPHLPEIFGLEVAARYRPAEDGVEVVGDFYDLFDVGDDGWGVVIGDVCGKGPDAAALTALARYTVRAAAIRERRPSRVLALLSQAVLHEESNERFCTAAYARVVPWEDRVTLELSCGGHPPPLVLRRDGSVERAGRPGTLLGLFEDVELFDDAVELEPGDALVMFTDGAIEARRGGEVLGEGRLRALVAACAGCPRAEDIAARLEDGVVSFQDGAAQDDLAFVVLRVPG